MPLRLLSDENISRHIEARLRLDGRRLTLASDVALGRPDTDVLFIAHRLGALVLTEDTDFGDLVWRQRLPSTGVILLRLTGLARAIQPEYVANMLSIHAAALPGMFTVITPTGTRLHTSKRTKPLGPLSRVRVNTFTKWHRCVGSACISK